MSGLGLNLLHYTVVLYGTFKYKLKTVALNVQKIRLRIVVHVEDTSEDYMTIMLK